MFFKSLFYLSILLALVDSVSAHMTIIDPCPRFSPWCINEPAALPAGVQYDYSIKNPIDPASTLLCKSNTSWPSPVATWTAGQSVTIQFYPNGAAHGGGHAQFSVSYDGGNTFAVVYEVLKYMFFNGPSSSNTPEVLSYTFTLPADLPNSDSVIFAWSWVNAIGNREFYMNCADVAITGSSSSSYTGKQMVIADHDGYPTIPEFGGDYTTGLSYYENSANVTVTGSGPYTSNYNAVKANADPAQESVVSNTDPTQGSIVSNTDPTQDNIFNIVNIVTTTAMPAELEVDDPVEATDADLGSTDSDIDDEDNAGASDVESNIDSDVESSVDSEIESDGGNGCTNGAMSCASDSSGYEICVLGNIVSIPCGTGTVCKGTYGAIYCGWP